MPTTLIVPLPISYVPVRSLELSRTMIVLPINQTFVALVIVSSAPQEEV
jgi:hypothetical protein